MPRKSAPVEFEEGKITVAVRCRPFNEREKDLKSGICLAFAPNGQTLTIYEKGVPSSDAHESEASKGHPYTFDHAYGMKATQEQIYADVGRPVMHASFNGFNTCIFAYGQTGSGKSFCMMGPTGPNAKPELRGITPRLCCELFQEVQSRCDEAKQKHEEAVASGALPCDRPPLVQFVVEVSYLEIYQENVKCLLNPKKDKLKVRQHPVTGVYVENLTEVAVHDYEKVLDMVETGNGARQVAATNMNDQSSRSHAIFSIILTQKRTSMTKDGSEMVSEIKAKINLVDLAGSERAKSTGAEGGTLKEGAQINKSLSTLGLVISGLADQAKKLPGSKAPFIPYRDSMLTWLLKESLGGNSKTFMVSTLSPAVVNFDETMSTLRYADRAKAIVTRACVNENPGDKKIRELEEEISKLRDFIKQMGTAPANSASLSPLPIPVSESSDDGEAAMTVVQLQERLEQVTTLFAKEQLSAEEKEEQQRHDLEEIEAQIRQRKSIKAPKQDPYLLNLDNIGDWVAETLSDEVTYMGTEDLVDPVVGARCIIIQGSDEDMEGIGPQHCCFIRNTERGTIILRPIEGWNTYIDNEEDPITKDTFVSNGQVIHLGETFIGFKLIEPTVAPQTARNRRTMLTARLSLRDEPASATASASTNSIASPTVPVTKVPPLSISQTSHTADTNQPHATLTRPTPGPSPSSTVRTPRLASVQGGAAPNDVVDIIYRHTFIFVGKPNSGKSATRSSLSKEDKWFPFFKKEVPATKSTFGVERSTVRASGVVGKSDLVFVELGGNSSFASLQQLLPERRVTYVLCFRLTDDNCSLTNFRSLLEYILCQSSSNETRVVLLGTCTDISSLDTSNVTSAVANLSNEVAHFFKTRQQRSEMCPQVVAKFALSNKDRTVVSVGGNASVTKISDLLCWMADYAIQRCKSDKDFPNAAIPSRAMRLALQLSRLREKGVWCVPSHEYKKIAKDVDIAYERSTETLQQHTQLLHCWGLLHHHYRHLHLRKTIVLDVTWVTRLLATICCCIPSQHNARAIESLSLSGSVVELSKYGLLSPEILQYSHSLPFMLSEVKQVDPVGHATLGVLTIKLLATLFEKLILEKNYERGDIDPVLELLESYDLIIRGSRLKISRDIRIPDRHTVIDESCYPLNPAEEEEDPLEAFYVMPACFVSQPPTTLIVHLPQLLFGPHYKFQMNMVPPHFFARFVSRVSRYAERIYLGPLHLRLEAGRDLPEYSDKCHLASARLWSNCAWIISSPESRALARMVNNSLFITFHDYANDQVFHEGLRDVVHCLVAENPGAECQEQILCVDDGQEIWLQKSENINSMEKILEREQTALRTARGQAPPVDDDFPASGPVPLVRPNDVAFDIHGTLSTFVSDCMFDDDTFKRVEHALHLIGRGRTDENIELGVALETCGFDLLVDSLANA